MSAVARVASCLFVLVLLQSVVELRGCVSTMRKQGGSHFEFVNVCSSSFFLLVEDCGKRSRDPLTLVHPLFIRFPLEFDLKKLKLKNDQK